MEAVPATVVVPCTLFRSGFDGSSCGSSEESDQGGIPRLADPGPGAFLPGPHREGDPLLGLHPEPLLRRLLPGRGEDRLLALDQPPGQPRRVPLQLSLPVLRRPAGPTRLDPV